MAQQIQELIDKIKSEGLEAAQKKSCEIEQEARVRAERIIKEAEAKAQVILIQAQAAIKKMEESAHMALKQASRDTLLVVRKDINNLLKTIVTLHVSETLTPEFLTHILESVAKHTLDGKGASAEIRALVNAHDLERLKKGSLARLQEQMKHPFKIEGSSEINRGLMISFDAGKTNFDFTDASLADYVGTYLNTELAALLKDAVKA